MHSHSYLIWYIFICVIYQYNRLGQCMLLDTIHALISRKIHWRQVISQKISMICVEIHWDKVLERFSPDHLDHSIISFCSHSYLCWARSCEFGRPAGRSGVCWDGRLRFGRWRSKAQTCEATKGVWCYANRSFLDVADGNQFGHVRTLYLKDQQLHVVGGKEDTPTGRFEDLMGMQKTTLNQLHIFIWWGCYQGYASCARWGL